MKEVKLDYLKIHPEVKFTVFDTGYEERKYLLQIRDRKFTLNEFLYDIALKLDGTHSVVDITKYLTQKYEHDFQRDEIQDVIINQFSAKHLLDFSEQPVETKKEKNKKSPLLMQITLINEKYLKYITNNLKFAFSMYIFVPIIAITLIQRIYMYSNPFEWESFNYYLFLGIIISSVLSHEFGHATACTYYGQSCKEIGCGLYFTIPVFFADVTNAWALKRNQRLVVDFGGAYFQFIHSLLLYLIYLITPVPEIRIALGSIDLMLLFSLNPFLKYDGYWMLSDLIGVPNLHTVSFRLLFAFFKLKVTEEFIALKKRERIILVFYAFGNILFFGYFFFMMFNQVPDLIGSLINLIKRGFDSNFSIISYLNYKAFRTVFMIYILSRLLSRLFKPVVSLTKKFRKIPDKGVDKND